MYEYIELSSSPVNEECAQLGADDYEERSRIECRIYKQQLQRMFPIPAHLEEYIYFAIKKFEHDFGAAATAPGGSLQVNGGWYREVIIKYDYNNDAAADFAYNVEENIPKYWDDESLKALEIMKQQAV